MCLYNDQDPAARSRRAVALTVVMIGMMTGMAGTWLARLPGPHNQDHDFYCGMLVGLGLGIELGSLVLMRMLASRRSQPSHPNA